MYAESKRVNISLAVLYILLGFLVSFSFALPLFLFMRETKLERAVEEGKARHLEHEEAEQPSCTRSDQGCL